MLFTFIIPVYNCIEYLENCVESIKKVTSFSSHKIHIILVDDGSFDGSALLCDQFACDSCITVIHQKNCGVSNARNHGINLSCCDYLLFIDSDDTIDAKKMAHNMDVIASDSAIDMLVYGISFNYYRNGKCYRKDAILPALSGVKSKSDWLNSIDELYNTNALSSMCTRIVKSSIIYNNCLLLNEKMFLFEDLEFIFRLSAHCNNIYFSQDDVYQYRQTEDEGNAGRRLKRILHLNNLIDELQIATNGLYTSSSNDVKKKIDYIIFSLYQLLAISKIFVSNVKEIKIICKDFSYWWNSKNIEIKPSGYVKKILKCDICYFLYRRMYSKIRHFLAVRIKSIINKR